MKNQFHIVTISFVLLICIITITNLINISDFYASLFILGTSFVGLFFTINETKKNNILVKKLSREAMHDGMTGLLNHRYFEKRLNEEIERSERYQQNFSLLFLDLDKFKRINDTYGHLFGDLVIKDTANIIKNNVRTHDVVARYGGEEYAVILVNTNKEDCMKTVKRIRENVENHIYTNNEVSERMTISIGIAQFPEDSEEARGLIRFADERMYEVKKLGGNMAK